MKSDYRRIVAWLAVSAVLSGAFFWLSPSAGGIHEAVVLLVGFGAVVTLTFLLYAVFEAGSGASPRDREAASVHRLGWGAMLIFGAGATAPAACGLLLLRDAQPFWLWTLGPALLAAWAYFLVMTMLYRAVCDERRLMVRNFGFGWTHHDWGDLASIIPNGYGFTLRFERTGFVEIPSGLTGLDHLRAVANEALERNKRGAPSEDA